MKTLGAPVRVVVAVALCCLVSTALTPGPVRANPIPVGACCLPNGNCELTDEESCEALGGAWNPLLPCDPNPCSPGHGVCCFADGSCALMTPVDCQEQGGTFMGSEVESCDPNPCPPCFVPCGGACCFPDGHCEYIPDWACFDLEGTWMGSSIQCAPDPCEAMEIEDKEPSVEIRSWGQLKELYR